MDIKTLLQTIVKIIITLSNVVRVMAQQFSAVSIFRKLKEDFIWSPIETEIHLENCFTDFGDCLSESITKLHLMASFKSFTSCEDRWLKKIEEYKDELWLIIKQSAEYIIFSRYGYNSESNEYTKSTPITIDKVEYKFTHGTRIRKHTNADPYNIHLLRLIPVELFGEYGIELFGEPIAEFNINGQKYYTYLDIHSISEIAYWRMSKRNW